MKNVISIEHEVITLTTDFENFTSRLEESLGLLRPEILDGLQADPATFVGMLENLGGEQELVLFNIIEHGELLRIKGKPNKAKQYQIGNPVIALRMTQRDIRSGLYTPLRLLVYENYDRTVVVEYDLPSSLFSQYDDAVIDEVAITLDKKIAHLIADADLQ